MESLLESLRDAAALALVSSASYLSSAAASIGGLAASAPAAPPPLRFTPPSNERLMRGLQAALGVVCAFAMTVQALQILGVLGHERHPEEPSTAPRGGSNPPPTLVLTEHERRLWASCVLAPGGRGGLSRAPSSSAAVAFEDVGGLAEQVAALHELVVTPLNSPGLTAHSRVLQQPTGLLLHGPPGTGKTLLARALARSSAAAFLALSPATVQSKWVGESVKFISAAFSLARKLAPCILFIDEIDGLLPSRDTNVIQQQHTVELTTSFLAEWEGVGGGGGVGVGEKQEGAPSPVPWVLVVGATNRPWAVDAAALRRMPRQLRVPLPNACAREDILRVLLRTERCAPHPALDLSAVAHAASGGYSGSDLRECVREAAWAPLREVLAAREVGGGGGEGSDEVEPPVRGLVTADLLAALRVVPPSGAIAASGQAAKQSSSWWSS